MSDMARMERSKALRDAAREVVSEDVARIRRGLDQRSLPGRALDRTAEGAAELLDELGTAASRHKGALAAAVAGVALWLARHPLMNLLSGGTDDDTENDDEQP